MNNRERMQAIMHYSDYDRMPVVSFGYWHETLTKWRVEGHVTPEEEKGYGDNNAYDRAIMARLGFDFNWGGGVGGSSYLFPMFQTEVLRTEPDGSEVVRNGEGLIVKIKPGIVSGACGHVAHGARGMGGAVPAEARGLRGARERRGDSRTLRGD